MSAASSPLTCPECGHEVHPSGVSTRAGVGDGSGFIAWRPPRTHRECEVCEAKLVKRADDPADPWRFAA